MLKKKHGFKDADIIDIVNKGKFYQVSFPILRVLHNMHTRQMDKHGYGLCPKKSHFFTPRNPLRMGPTQSCTPLQRTRACSISVGAPITCFSCRQNDFDKFFIREKLGFSELHDDNKKKMLGMLSENETSSKIKKELFKT